MLQRSLLLAAALLAFAGASACGPAVDLNNLKIIDPISGFYDAGLKDGKNYLVPSVTFRLQNTGSVHITGLELTVAYWRDGEDGEWDSTLVQRIGNDRIEAGGQSDPITVRAPVGYTLESPRADLFTHSQFKDVTAKIFGRRAGTIVPLGQIRLERQILPHVRASDHRP